MICENPVIRGFYPDPSVCAANGKFYLVNSTFEYFPGMPVFESDDLVHWKQINNCLTRKSQLDVQGIAASGGIYAPTIRFNKGRFYVVVTNVSNDYGNFYVYTDDIYGEWSEPVKVDRGGIDPSLLFDGDKTYFISNGADDYGVNGISLCEIDIETGKKLTEAKCISTGCGGRYLEGPHLYHINDWYYLMVAEGGTEYGHMECMLRSKNIWGPYEACPSNPILTNRNLGGYEIQGAGHADLVQAEDGQWFMVHLAFRQIGQYDTFHNLGRETYLMPVFWNEDGWPEVGADGTCRKKWELKDGKCTILDDVKYPEYKFGLEKLSSVYLRLPEYSDYKISYDSKGLADCAEIRGGKDCLGSTGQVSFVGSRQPEHNAKMSVKIHGETLALGQSAGITAYLTEKDYYYIEAERTESGIQVKADLVLYGKVCSGKKILLTGENVQLMISSDNYTYKLCSMDDEGNYVELNNGPVKFLSSEVACGFTGVILALYVNGSQGYVKFSW